MEQITAACSACGKDITMSAAAYKYAVYNKKQRQFFCSAACATKANSHKWWITTDGGGRSVQVLKSVLLKRIVECKEIIKIVRQSSLGLTQDSLAHDSVAQARELLDFVDMINSILSILIQLQNKVENTHPNVKKLDLDQNDSIQTEAIPITNRSELVDIMKKRTTTPITFACGICGKTVVRKANQVSIANLNTPLFCGQACYAKYARKEYQLSIKEYQLSINKNEQAADARHTEDSAHTT